MRIFTKFVYLKSHNTWTTLISVDVTGHVSVVPEVQPGVCRQTGIFERATKKPTLPSQNQSHW